MARKSARQARLEQGEAMGKLKPEHIAELNALRASQGGAGGGSAPAPKAADLKSLNEAQGRAEAAGKSIRLYQNVAPAMDRFRPGSFKGKAMSMIMPSEDDGLLGNLASSTIGAAARALVPTQTKQDYETLDAARAERVALRQLEQKGVQTDKDAARYAKADITPNRSLASNRKTMRDNTIESNLVKIRSNLETQWVARFGSKSRAAPNGMTFDRAVDFAERDFLKARGPNRPKAPPSTRKPSNGWSIQEVK